jgi:hypothetical protein
VLCPNGGDQQVWGHELPSPAACFPNQEISAPLYLALAHGDHLFQMFLTSKMFPETRGAMEVKEQFSASLSGSTAQESF